MIKSFMYNKDYHTTLICLSGWSYSSFIFSILANTKFNIIGIDYLDYKPTESLFNNLDSILPKKQRLILLGWSLGGYVALKLAQKYNFSQVIFLNTNIDFVGNDNDLKVYNQFLNDFLNDYKKQLKHFDNIICLGSNNSCNLKAIISYLRYKSFNKNILYDWLLWQKDYNFYKELNNINKNINLTYIWSKKDKILSDFAKKEIELKSSNIFNNNILFDGSHLSWIDEFDKFKKLLYKLV